MSQGLVLETANGSIATNRLVSGKMVNGYDVKGVLRYNGQGFVLDSVHEVKAFDVGRQPGQVDPDSIRLV